MSRSGEKEQPFSLKYEFTPNLRDQNLKYSKHMCTHPCTRQHFREKERWGTRRRNDSTERERRGKNTGYIDRAYNHSTVCMCDFFFDFFFKIVSPFLFSRGSILPLSLPGYYFPAPYQLITKDHMCIIWVSDTQLNCLLTLTFRHTYPLLRKKFKKSVKKV